MKNYPFELKKYFKIDEAAFYFSIDPSFLKNRMNIDFFEGIHYFKGVNSRITRWDIKALDKCIFGLIDEEEENELLSTLAA
ncbi:hypothetical protein [Sulfurimonas sp. CS5]|uniref:hypothetical protein n=1 Tax=Sulfurimonas sp. CS5 TaxID=3391145 RepID=UPI0039E79259